LQTISYISFLLVQGPYFFWQISSVTSRHDSAARVADRRSGLR